MIVDSPSFLDLVLSLTATNQEQRCDGQSQHYDLKEDEHSTPFLAKRKDSQHHQSTGAHAGRNNVGRHAPKNSACTVNRIRFVRHEPAPARIGTPKSRQTKKQEKRDRKTAASTALSSGYRNALRTENFSTQP